jgi:hypothetical protein
MCPFRLQVSPPTSVRVLRAGWPYRAIREGGDPPWAGVCHRLAPMHQPRGFPRSVTHPGERGRARYPSGLLPSSSGFAAIQFQVVSPRVVVAIVDKPWPSMGAQRASCRRRRSAEGPARTKGSSGWSSRTFLRHKNGHFGNRSSLLLLRRHRLAIAIRGLVTSGRITGSALARHPFMSLLPARRRVFRRGGLIECELTNGQLTRRWH